MKKKRANKRYLTGLSSKEYLRRYLKVAPLALAVFRTIEAKNIAGERMERPLLDVGCGFGEFAGVFFDSKVEMGLDVSWRDLVGAKKTSRYKKLTWADARDLPFGDNYFKTVLSVSVMEHINSVEEVVKEIYRVLTPGGQFIFTVNTDKVTQMLYWPRFLTRLKLDHWAKKYQHFYNWLFKHKTLWSQRKWRRLLLDSGFEIKTCREIISRPATELFDFFIITSWPSQLIKLIFGKRWAWRPKWFREILVSKYSKFVEEDKVGDGSNLFVVAVKPKKTVKKQKYS